MDKIKICKITRLPFAIFTVAAMFKLAGAIGWPWWIITLPLWINLAAVLAIIVALCVIVLGAFVIAFVCLLIYLLGYWIVGLFKK